MKYISKYSNNKEVSAAQFITEIICEHKAKKDGKDLHYRFWTNQTWAKFYRDQIATANKLVQTYNPQAIVKALFCKDAEKIFSLRAPHLIPIIEQEQKIFDESNTEISIEYDRSESKTFIKNTTTKSILSRLEELE